MRYSFITIVTYSLESATRRESLSDRDGLDRSRRKERKRRSSSSSSSSDSSSDSSTSSGEMNRRACVRDGTG